MDLDKKTPHLGEDATWQLLALLPANGPWRYGRGPHQRWHNGRSTILYLAGPQSVAALMVLRERFNTPGISAERLILKLETPATPDTTEVLSGHKELL